MTLSPKNPRRAPLSASFVELRARALPLLALLEADADWYASLYFERRASQTQYANLKRTSATDETTVGAVLRIYDGHTLFEQATDDLSPSRLTEAAHALVARVRAAPSIQAPRRLYRAPSWKERLAPTLEREITEQIPADPGPATPVHFGIRFTEDPTAETTAQALAKLKRALSRLQELAPAQGLAADSLSFAMARQTIGVEESLFIDRESNLSQTLYRVGSMIMVMSGADRSYVRNGGLGGLEAIEITDAKLGGLLRELHGLKGATRLAPGRYRVLFGPVVSGVLAHEAFGHAQEADTCARGRSKAWELHRTGELVGNENATILNNPAAFENADEPCAAWGSYFFDEEGWLAREQVLLDRGKLQAPMTNLTSALRLGIPRTANGKREKWTNGVYTRQTNTYFSAGDQTLEQMLERLGDGFIALHPAGGMEDPKGMGIQVGIAFLEEVKGGQRTGRVLKGPAGGDIQLTGYTPDILNSIVCKSKIDADSDAPDSSRFPFNDAGGCGKYHKEFVYAGCGGPYLLLDAVTLG